MAELTRSATASKAGIDNLPSLKEQDNLQALCRDILQPLRESWGEPIIVSSGYRSRELNRIVGGVKYSDHTFGSAADIHTLSNRRIDNRRLFEMAVRLMNEGRLKNVKQIINEYDYSWLHIARQDGRSQKRNQVLSIS